jgi:hypothetical protein
MSWYPNGYVSGGKPTAARVKEYAGTEAFGPVQKAMGDAAAALKAKEDHALKRRLHAPMTEIWTFKKPRRPYIKAGRWEVEGVRRDPQGRFAAQLSAVEIAAIIGGSTTAANVPPPKKRKGRGQ